MSYAAVLSRHQHVEMTVKMTKYNGKSNSINNNDSDNDTDTDNDKDTDNDNDDYGDYNRYY